MPQSQLVYLSAEALRLEGINEPWNFGVADAVRFSELDVLNHANNAAYISWLENARISYFVNYEISDYVSEERPNLVVRNLEIDFLAPLQLGDPYIVTARSVEYGRTSWKMKHAVVSCGKLAAEASCTIVTVNKRGSTSVPLTQSIIETISVRDSAKMRA